MERRYTGPEHPDPMRLSPPPIDDAETRLLSRITALECELVAEKRLRTAFAWLAVAGALGYLMEAARRVTR